MAHRCRVGPARGQWDRVGSTGPPAANFTSTTDMDSTSSTDISSASCLGKVGFKTLDAQAYFSYDLNFAGKREEWTRTFYNSDYSTSSAYISRLIMRMPVWQSVSYRDGEEVFPEDGRAVNLAPLNQHEIMDNIAGFFGISPRIPQTANHRMEPNGWFGKLMGFSPYLNHQGVSTCKLDQMVFRDDAGNRFYVDSWDLCNCPRVVGKPVGQTCKDKEGKRSCQPGSSLHDKSRNCILKRHPGVVLVDGASIHDGKLDLKLMTINVDDANGLMLRSKFGELQAAVLNDYDRALAL